MLVRSVGPLARSLAVALVCALAVSACGPSVTRNPLPAELATTAHPLGIPGLRAYGDVIENHELDAFVERQATILRARFGAELAAGRSPTLNYLAISGGGPDGAFGAGVLKAWTATGTRPEFFGVSGVSTGSIIAPFAFLGSEYDHVLEEIYTTLKTDDIIEERLVSGIISGIALSDTSGLARKIAQYVTPELLEKIAEQYKRGRILVVGTTNLDAGRPMIWNMGAIAASGHPDALRLFREVIRASAAVPIAFPPELIKVQTADGRVFDEMHVDGGATSQVVLVSPQMPIAELTRRHLGRNIDRRLFVLVNNKVLGEYKEIRPRIGPVGGAAVSALIRGSGIGDAYKLFTIAQRDEIAYRAAWIPRHTPCPDADGFDPAYMRCLFDFAGSLVREGNLWSDAPPYFVMPAPAPARPQRRAGRPAS